ncbi:MAG: nucleoside triphosphate pyrophosphohydrolase [Anaerolineae bacterium]
MGITIVGLGPGDGRYLTREAWNVLTEAEVVWLRTARHPAVDDLPTSLTKHSFDHLYEQKSDFEDVYNAITAELITHAKDKDIVYAVPGHPHVGESTVTRLQVAAVEHQVHLQFVAGLSFIEPCLTAAGIDGMEGLQVHDALDVASMDYPCVNPDFPLLLGQVYSRLVASDLKEILTAVYPDEHPVVLIHGAGSANEVVERIHLYEIDHSEHTSHLTSLYMASLPAKSDMSAFAEIIATLRGPDGCPWDQKQTPQSMRDGFLEEMAEVLDALDRGDEENLCEELGDLLLHITMQAQMAAEDGAFTLTDVISGIYAKIIRRHPHVWGTTEVEGTDDVVSNWEAIKAQEKAKKEAPGPRLKSVLDNIPPVLPALARSQKIQNRVRKVGFDWQDIEGVYDKLQEEVAEIQAAETKDHQLEEIGDLLFVTVNLAKWLGLDAEIALREANLKFERRFRELELLAHAQDWILTDLGESELISLWDKAKELTA